MSELLGLRGRLTVAMVAVSALTLVVTSLLLLFPLDRSLRHDVRASVVSTARAARPGLTALPPSTLRAGSPRLARTAAELHRRTRMDIAIFDAQGARLVATDVGPHDRFPEVRQALATDRVVSRLGRGEGEAQAQVALPVEAGRRPFAVSFRKSLEDLNGAQDVVRRSLIAAAFVALAVALVAGIALATQLARRVTALRDLALDVAEQGPGRPVATDHRRDEIGDLTRAFATMQRRLEDQERARRAFVSTASHELRTPLASLRLMLHAAGEELTAPAPDLGETRAQVTEALEQTVRLGQLADELLDVSRLDAGLALRSEPVELTELARAVVAEFAMRPGAPVDLVADGPAWATADPGAVARILRILVDNGLRHGAGGEVSVRVGGAGGEAAVTVADTGPGIALQDAERVFRRFERGRDTGEARGFGLGLAIARETAERMGGRLRLTAPGPGPEFVLTLAAHIDPNTVPTRATPEPERVGARSAMCSPFPRSSAIRPSSD